MNNFQMQIKLQLLEQGASLIGFADMSDIAPDIGHFFEGAISFGVAIQRSVIQGISNGPTEEYEKELHKIDSILQSIARKAQAFLEQSNIKSMIITPRLKQDSTLTNSLTSEDIAVRAGLGWIGKTNLLITKQFGSAVVLATILCNIKFQCHRRNDQSFCEDCEQCLNQCPAKMKLDTKWDISSTRKKLYQKISCREACDTIRRERGIVVSLCGQCIHACPWTQRYLDRGLKRSMNQRIKQSNQTNTFSR